MGDVHITTLLRPMTSDELQAEAMKAQKARLDEIAELERVLAEKEAEGQDPDPDLQEKLEGLREYDIDKDLEGFMDKRKVKIALRSVTRQSAFRRARLQKEAKEWLMEQLGVSDWSEVNLEALDDDEDVGEKWITMYQAADIIPALVVDECSGWDIPENLVDWADVKDFIFAKALADTWALNPQFVLGNGLGEL